MKIREVITENITENMKYGTIVRRKRGERYYNKRIFEHQTQVIFKLSVSYVTGKGTADEV